METEYTEDSWKITSQEIAPHKVIVYDQKTSKRIALCYNSKCSTPQLYPSKKEAQSNAKLIAASPKLLEVCIEALAHHQGFHSVIGNKLREAIKKATE